ncbi:MAG: class I SAM-dependent methyltransferase, partial [Candidatus Diapherotrites archaeon]|nr:class I SAM-dependent methyltransferase [Candidatus Diapherotrites archaeon]
MKTYNSYSNFADVYDVATDDECYLEWFDFVSSLVSFKPNFVLDLGCGTGKSTFIFAKKFTILGIEPSKEMVLVARRKAKKLGYKVDFQIGSAQNFKMKTKPELIISFGEMVNHILNEVELETALKNIYANLSSKGLFLFGFNSLKRINEMH